MPGVRVADAIDVHVLGGGMHLSNRGPVPPAGAPRDAGRALQGPRGLGRYPDTPDGRSEKNGCPAS